jgi:hypothetical protein
MEQDVIAMRVKELRQEIAELTRYYEESVSLKPSLIQERLQESRIERLEEIKRELKLREIPERTIQRTITSE